MGKEKTYNFFLNNLNIDHIIPKVDDLHKLCISKKDSNDIIKSVNNIYQAGNLINDAWDILYNMRCKQYTRKKRFKKYAVSKDSSTNLLICFSNKNDARNRKIS